MLATATMQLVAEIANNRAVIDQAKGMLILVYGVEEDGAFEEQSSIPVDQDLLCGLLGSGGVVGPFDEFAVLELRAGADERHEMGRVDRPPA